MNPWTRRAVVRQGRSRSSKDGRSQECNATTENVGRSGTTPRIAEVPSVSYVEEYEDSADDAMSEED